MRVAEIETPAVLVDVARLDRNIARVQAHADRQGVALHPHVKTHKCLEIARRQLSAGAAGLTASKPAEAAVFLDAGAPMLTVAYPVLEAGQVAALLATARRQRCHLRLIVDSPETVAAAQAAATGGAVECLLKVDVGLGRVGVSPGTPDVATVADAVVAAPGLCLGGLLSHAGHAYGAEGPDGIRAIAQRERRLLAGVRDQLGETGLGSVTSVGCTPVALAEAQAGSSADGVTEIRPGNYVFLDLTALRLGIASLDEIALFVLSRVISVGPNHAIIDAGSKTLSSDGGPHGSGTLQGYGHAFRLDEGGGLPGDRDGSAAASWTVERLSEEHGFVRLDGRPLAVGDRLVIVPNHACPVVNLTDRLTAVADGAVRDRWQVDART